MKWIRIDEQKPMEGQEVFYWFEPFEEIYKGKFFMDNYEGRLDWNPNKPGGDIFADKGGWLTDDVTYWMPYNNGDKFPDPPTIEQRKKCLYHGRHINE